MENRRLFLAVFLSALILIVWNSIFPPAPPPSRAFDDPMESAGDDGRVAPQQERTEGTSPERLEAEMEAVGDEDTGGLQGPQTQIEFKSEVVASEIEDHPVLENELVRVEFSNRGAQLVSFRLKQHRVQGEDSLELVRSRGSDPYPFSLVTAGEKSHRLNKALFVWETESEPGLDVLRFRHRSGRGVAEKVFRLHQDGLMEAEIEVLGDRDWSVVMGPGLRNLDPKESSSRFVRREVGYRRGDSLETISRESQEADELIPAQGLQWVTLEDNFFLLAVMPESGVKEVIVRSVLQRMEIQEDQPRFLPADSEVTGETSKEQMLLLEASGQRMEIVTLFGAKRYSRLVSLPYGLEETVRWGWFGFLSKPLYFALEWIHRRIVPNYGWAIVLVTFLIKVLFFPLTHKGQESTGRMQELNPKVQAIKNKYRSKLKDRKGRPNPEASRQMNEEIMKVYKAAGVNPASGCLPILLQAPVFFAFFRLLSTAVELRNAPWIGWIKDLSVADPWFILPLVMGGTSVATQRMMPAPPDPMQRRMMQLLPIMFTVFAFQFPSGLVLYWITNNLLSMVQQAIMNRLKRRREAQSG